MTEYVAGFLFSKDKDGEDVVLLIEKLKPEWQKGRLNGVGGKIEKFDILSENAMSREFVEEAGVLIEPKEWILFTQYFWKDGIVNFFFTHDIDNKYYNKVYSVTDEKVTWVKIHHLWLLPRIYNLSWLIPLALDPSLDFKNNGPIKVCE